MPVYVNGVQAPPGASRATLITNPPVAPIDANTSALALAFTDPVITAPTATRQLDVGNAPWSMRLHIYKNVRALFGWIIPAAVGWTGPAGLNQDYLLPGSSDQLCGAWDVIIDVPNKTYYVVTYPRGIMEPMISAPTAGPGDTLDLFAGGTFTGRTNGCHQTGAPTSDGSAFIVNDAPNTRAQENRGDGYGAMLLMEPATTNFVLQSETIFTGAAITAPWVAIDGNTTGLGQQAGSPRGDATVTNLIFAGASAATGVKQVMTGAATTAQTIGVLSVWAKIAAGTGKFRLQFLDKSGATITSADFNLTTTWARYDLLIPNIGIFGSVGTAEARIINASDATNRTIQVWGAQMETGRAAPTTYVKTVAATVARVGDTLFYAPSAYPATFLSRGVSVDYAPDFNNIENWQGQANLALCTFDNGFLGPNVGRDWFIFSPVFNQFQIASRRGRLAVLSSGEYRGLAAADPTGPAFQSPPFQFARGVKCTLTAEAYRGAIRIQGTTDGDGRYALGGGPWTWPNGTMTIGQTLGGVAALNGRFGRFITAA